MNKQEIIKRLNFTAVDWDCEIALLDNPAVMAIIQDLPPGAQKGILCVIAGGVSVKDLKSVDYQQWIKYRGLGNVCYDAMAARGIVHPRRINPVYTEAEKAARRIDSKRIYRLETVIERIRNGHARIAKIQEEINYSPS